MSVSNFMEGVEPPLVLQRDKKPSTYRVKITSGKGYFIDTINPGGDNLYTADQICRMVEFLIDNIFVKLGECPFVRSCEIPMGRFVSPCQPTSFFTPMKVNVKTT